MFQFIWLCWDPATSRHEIFFCLLEAEDNIVPVLTVGKEKLEAATKRRSCNICCLQVVKTLILCIANRACLHSELLLSLFYWSPEGVCCYAWKILQRHIIGMYFVCFLFPGLTGSGTQVHSVKWTTLLLYITVDRFCRGLYTSLTFSLLLL